MVKKPIISVAIPTYNREEVLVATIHDVLNQSLVDLELIVVDQSSKHKPETIEALGKIKDPRFRYYVVTPASVTVARNFALKQAKSPYIIFLDDDVVISKDLIKIFWLTFQRRPGVSAVAGRVLQEGFKVLPKVLKFDKYGMSYGGYTATGAEYTNAFPGGNCAMVIKDALKAGAFDTRYRGNAFREENDLSMRMAKMGQKIFYQPNAVLTHLAVPYGGHRIQTHLYDNLDFYVNELFFTMRCVKIHDLSIALWRKYRSCCGSMRHMQGYKRSLLFGVGMVWACCRLLFARQRTATVVREKLA